MGWIANVENAGEFIAAEQGYYAEEGVDLELVPGGPGVSVEPLVVSGKALVGLSQPDSVARARQQGAALKVVATTFQRNPAAIMSLTTNPVPTPQDLVGKKLGIQQKLQELKKSADVHWDNVKHDLDARIADFDKSVKAIESKIKGS
jgi:ABC-type nitrate/sulfonate/bicarbonate transport system substrate-binding protein